MYGPRKPLPEESKEGKKPEGKPKRKKKRKVQVVINMEHCKYEVVEDCALARNWRIVGDDDNVPFNVYWIDTSVSTERVMALENYQKINHFPGMSTLSRKNGLARALRNMQRMFPDDYAFAPQSWTLPADYKDFKAQFMGKEGRKNRTYIVKPDHGCQGKGIFLTRTCENVDPNEPQVAQRYLRKPLLIDGLKFDLRVYVLVTSCDPLRIFIYKDGLTRLCTEPYQEPTNKNLKRLCMHLTNYAINKTSDKFVFNEGTTDEELGTGSKRTLLWFRKWLDENDHDGEAVFARMEDMIVKTLISVQPTLAHMYRSCLPADNEGFSCFEILGLDVMIDAKLRPWLIEVNHSPSFGCDTPLDLQIKEGLISDTMAVIGVQPSDRRKHRVQQAAQAQSRLYSGVFDPSKKRADFAETRTKQMARRMRLEKKHMGGFKLICPPESPELEAKYRKLTSYAEDIFEDGVMNAGRRAVAAPRGKLGRTMAGVLDTASARGLAAARAVVAASLSERPGEDFESDGEGGEEDGETAGAGTGTGRRKFGARGAGGGSTAGSKPSTALSRGSSARGAPRLNSASRRLAKTGGILDRDRERDAGSYRGDSGAGIAGGTRGRRATGSGSPEEKKERPSTSPRPGRSGRGDSGVGSGLLGRPPPSITAPVGRQSAADEVREAARASVARPSRNPSPLQSPARAGAVSTDAAAAEKVSDKAAGSPPGVRALRRAPPKATTQLMTLDVEEPMRVSPKPKKPSPPTAARRHAGMAPGPSEGEVGGKRLGRIGGGGGGGSDGAKRKTKSLGAEAFSKTASAEYARESEERTFANWVTKHLPKESSDDGDRFDAEGDDSRPSAFPARPDAAPSAASSERRAGSARRQHRVKRSGVGAAKDDSHGATGQSAGKAKLRRVSTADAVTAAANAAMADAEEEYERDALRHRPSSGGSRAAGSRASGSRRGSGGASWENGGVTPIATSSSMSAAMSIYAPEMAAARGGRGGGKGAARRGSNTEAASPPPHAPVPAPPPPASFGEEEAATMHAQYTQYLEYLRSVRSSVAQSHADALERQLKLSADMSRKLAAARAGSEGGWDPSKSVVPPPAGLRRLSKSSQSGDGSGSPRRPSVNGSIGALGSALMRPSPRLDGAGARVVSGR